MKFRGIPYVALMCLKLSTMILPGGLSGKLAFEQQKVEIRVIPDYNHYPVRVGITTDTGKECWERIKVKSDASWVKPSIDLESGELILALDTLRLFNKKYNATIQGDLDGSRIELIVEAVIAGMDIKKMEEDPFRPRVYLISAPKDTFGSLLVYDPFHGKPVGSITLGNQPSDLALSKDGNELFVINSGDQSVNIFEAETLKWKETAELPVWGKDGNSIHPGHIESGLEKIFYYTDGAPNPGLHVYDQCLAKVVQTHHVGKQGIGHFALTHDNSRLVSWTQDSWHRGLHNTKLAVFKIGKDGKLEKTDGQEPADRETFH